jgi:hypothetical protein
MELVNHESQVVANILCFNSYANSRNTVDKKGAVPV